MTPFRPLLVAALIVGTSPAFAQATLDHNKALAGGAVPGDAPGYPITISQPGHYKLMGNLVVPAGATGIEIKATGVTLDLNGFRILGTGACAFDPSTYVVSCSGTLGYGVLVAADGTARTTVRNGTVQGFAYGVGMEGGRAESLTLLHNATGIFAAHGRFGGTLMSELHAEYNNIGIAFDGGQVQRSLVRANTQGVVGGTGEIASVLDSHVSANATGVRDAAVRGNFISLNKVNQMSTTNY